MKTVVNQQKEDCVTGTGKAESETERQGWGWWSETESWLQRQRES